MSDVVGAIAYDASINTAGFKRDAKTIESAVNNLGDSTSKAGERGNQSFLKMGAAMGIAAGIAGTVFSKAMGLVSSTIGDAVNRVDTLNNANRTFANMGFTAKDTADTMDLLKKSILGLPTSLDAAVRNVQLLASSTNDVKKSQKIFQALNDGILGFGGNADQVNTAVIQLSQAFAGGRVMAQDWNSMLNAGLGPALNAIAKKMGITTKALKDGLSDGSISVTKFQDSLIELDEKGGAGMASLQKIVKDSTSGIGTGMANAKTAVVRGLANILKAIGTTNISEAISTIGSSLETGLTAAGGAITKAIELFKGWLPTIQATASAVGDYLLPKFTALYNTFDQKIMPLLLEFWHNVVEPLTPVLGTVLVAAIGLVTDALNIVLTSVGWVVQALKDGNPFIWAMTFAFGALAASMALGAAFDAIKVGFATLQLVTIPSVTATMGTFRAFVASPMTMGAIGITAALVAIYEVYRALEAVRGAIQDVNNASKSALSAGASNEDVIRGLRELAKNGTPEQQARAKKALQGLANAGSFAAGGFTGVGGKFDIAGVVHKGEYVIPKEDVNQTTGQPKTGGMNITLNLSGLAARSRSDLRAIGKDIISSLNEELRSRGQPEIGGGAIS